MVSAMEGTWPEENVHAGAAPLPPPSPIPSCRNRSPRKMDLGSAFREKSIPFCAFCESKQAAFFCDADEAYLCHACDSSVHSANSLASKHKRIPVFESSVKFEDSVLNFEESVATLEESGSSARSEELGNSGSEAPSDEKFWSNLWTPTTCGLRIGGITYAKVTKVKVESESLIDHIDMQRFESNPGNLSKLRMSGNEISHEGARFVPVAQELPFFGAQEDGTMFPPFDFSPAWEEGAKKSCSTEYLVPEGGSADQFMDFGPEMFDLDVWNGGAKREIERGNEFFDVWKENGELGAKKYVQDLESGRNPMRRMLLKGRLGKIFQSGEPDSRAEDECAKSYSDDEDHHVGSSEKDLQEKRVGQIHAAEVPVLNSEENKEEIERNRRARVMRYREKRHTRLFSKKIRYEVRKINAERRPRIKGRFVKS